MIINFSCHTRMTQHCRRVDRPFASSNIPWHQVLDKKGMQGGVPTERRKCDSLYDPIQSDSTFQSAMNLLIIGTQLDFNALTTNYKKNTNALQIAIPLY